MGGARRWRRRSGWRSAGCRRRCREATSPDGRCLAFQSDRSGRYGIWAIDVDGGEPGPLFVDDAWTAIGPDWSPDGSLIAMTVLRPDPSRSYGFVTVWVVGADGENPRAVTSRGDEWWARFSADSDHLYYYVGATDAIKALLFSSDEGHRREFRQIWSLDVATGDMAAITRSPSSKRPTDCAADGGRAVFQLTAGQRGLYLLQRDGETWTQRRIDDDGRGGRLSPDGRRIAFVRRTDGRTDLFLWSGDGRVERLTDDAAEESAPSWTADGERVVFSVSRTNRDIWIAPVLDL